MRRSGSPGDRELERVKGGAAKRPRPPSCTAPCPAFRGPSGSPCPTGRFDPRPLGEGATGVAVLKRGLELISIRAFGKKATGDGLPVRAGHGVSIHAPSQRGRRQSLAGCRTARYFNPRPARGRRLWKSAAAQRDWGSEPGCAGSGPGTGPCESDERAGAAWRGGSYEGEQDADTEDRQGREAEDQDVSDSSIHGAPPFLQHLHAQSIPF